MYGRHLPKGKRQERGRQGRPSAGRGDASARQDGMSSTTDTRHTGRNRTREEGDGHLKTQTVDPQSSPVQPPTAWRGAFAQDYRACVSSRMVLRGHPPGTRCMHARAPGFCKRVRPEKNPLNCPSNNNPDPVHRAGSVFAGLGMVARQGSACSLPSPLYAAQAYNISHEMSFFSDELATSGTGDSSRTTLIPSSPSRRQPFSISATRWA